MLERTTQTTVTFSRPAHLQEGTLLLAAGVDVVETDEEIIPGLSFVAYRRLKTSIILPITGGLHAGRQVTEIDPDDLAAALARDRAAGLSPILTGQ